VKGSFRIVLSIHGSDFPGSEIGSFEPGNVFQDLETGKNRGLTPIESKLIPCERCGTVVAMLIFAPNAADAGHLEDYARKMYRHYNHLNVPTWIIGPALGEGPLIDRPADVLKVWPAREPIQRLPPAQFNSLLDQFVTRHCH
jgi:hypothetical protein